MQISIDYLRLRHHRHNILGKSNILIHRHIKNKSIHPLGLLPIGCYLCLAISHKV